MSTHAQNHDSESKFKERMNFAKMLERQEKQIQNSPVMDLIQATDTHKPISSPKITNNSDIELKLERIETLLLKNRFSFTIKNPKAIYAVAISIILSSIIFNLSQTPKTLTKEVIVEKTISSEKLDYLNFVATDYVNLREAASGSAAKILVLAPNSYVKVLEKKPGWTKVSFKDQVKGKLHTGWIFGENLMKVSL